MKKIAAFCPAGKNYDEMFRRLETSLRKFHSAEELPLLRFDNPNPADNDFWYRSTPILASDLLKEYETVIKMDADQIILAPLTDLLTDKDVYDVGVVLNDPSYPIAVWDIAPIYNNGLVVLKSKEFAEHWKRLCFTQHFPKYQFREQDLLNILCSDYMNYNVKWLEGDKLYGEVAKPMWTQFRMVDGKVMFEGKQLCVYHAGGGSTPDKGNYRIRFDDSVVKYIDLLIK